MSNTTDRYYDKETSDGKTIFIIGDGRGQPLSRYDKLRRYITWLPRLVDEEIVYERLSTIESWDMDEIPLSPEDRYFEVTAEFRNRLDLISQKFYGTMHLYWVLAYVNEMIDPFAETIVGKQIRIPDRDNVFQAIMING